MAAPNRKGTYFTIRLLFLVDFLEKRLLSRRCPMRAGDSNAVSLFRSAVVCNDFEDRLYVFMRPVHGCLPNRHPPCLGMCFSTAAMTNVTSEVPDLSFALFLVAMG